MLKIFVNTWGNYNTNGADGGEWVTLPMDADELGDLLDGIAERMGDHDPEWAIHDYEWEAVELFEVGEYDTPHAINELLEVCEGMEEYELQEVAAAIEAYNYEFSEAVERQQRGCFIFYAGRTMEEVAEEIADEMIACYTHGGNVPEIFTRYFDYEAFARDLSYDYTETSYGVILDN